MDIVLKEINNLEKALYDSPFEGNRFPLLQQLGREFLVLNLFEKLQLDGVLDIRLNSGSKPESVRKLFAGSRLAKTLPWRHKQAGQIFANA